MRIAIAGSLNKPIVKNSLGGTEAFTYQLIGGLTKRGHQVTLFANADSSTEAHLVAIEETQNIRGVMESGIEVRFLYHLLQSQNLALASNQFDIVHNNYYDSFFLTPFSSWFKTPILTTIHNDFWHYKNMRFFYSQTHRRGIDAFVFVSQTAQTQVGNPLDSYVIANGIDPTLYEFAPQSDGRYLLFFSRIVWQKGAKEAVQAAREANQPLVLCGPIPKNTEGADYFSKSIEEFLSPTVHYMEPPDSLYKIRLYQSARALLFPIQWEEPFGLVLAESMSCGTPVIAFARGAIPEIIKDGVTGFIVNPSDQDIRGNWIIKSTGQKGLVEAIQRVFSLNESEYLSMRQACRDHVEANFTIDRMVGQYESLYSRLASGYQS